LAPVSLKLMPELMPVPISGKDDCSSARRHYAGYCFVPAESAEARSGIQLTSGKNVRSEAAPVRGGPPDTLYRSNARNLARASALALARSLSGSP
jgi:hypothetical protein